MDNFELMKIACKDIGFDLREDQFHKFEKYKDILIEWNQNINLTAITDENDIFKKHFIDSLKIYKFNKLLNAHNVIDIGTGAGFPGVPMGIIKNDTKVTLLDSLNKRITFLNLLIKELDLDNITTIHGRAEEYAVKGKLREKFDVAVSRAVANLTLLSEYCLPYVKVGGYFIALKGPSYDKEVEDAQKAIKVLGGSIIQIIPINIEDTDLMHNLIIVEKHSKTPDRFPRKPGVASKSQIV